MSIKVDVGTPSSNFEDWTTAEVRFHGFADLSTTRDEPVVSPKFSCFGHRWILELYPGGDEDSADGNVALDLCNASNKSIKMQWCISVRNAAGKEVVHQEPSTNEFDAWVRDVRKTWGKKNFCSRSTMIDALIEGTLIIEVRMRLKEIEVNKQFIPENPINKNILNKFNKEQSADVVFEVNNSIMNEQGGDGSAGKRAKSTTNFYAHRVILEDGASTLTEMCKPSGEGRFVTVSITDVKPDVFKQMLCYIYGGKVTDEELKVNAKDIIDAADKYGVVGLKLESEAFYVKSTTITVENMMDNLLYADSKNLALLKESVMDFILKNKKDIIGKVSFDNVPGAMITDILAAVARGEPKEEGDGNNGGIDYHKMRVGTLRKMLDEKGLDVDGSREAMIALLKENA